LIVGKDRAAEEAIADEGESVNGRREEKYARSLKISQDFSRFLKISQDFSKAL